MACLRVEEGPVYDGAIARRGVGLAGVDVKPTGTSTNGFAHAWRCCAANRIAVIVLIAALALVPVALRLLAGTNLGGCAGRRQVCGRRQTRKKPGNPAFIWLHHYTW
jgi:hypothetical protein